MSFRKALALVCCVAFLLTTASGAAFGLCCDCHRTNGPAQSNCCTIPETAPEQSRCCQPIPQRLAHIDGDVQLNAERGHCSCFGVPVGPESSGDIVSISSTKGGQSDHPLATALCAPVELLVEFDQTTVDHLSSPSTATAILGTVVMQR